MNPTVATAINITGRETARHVFSSIGATLTVNGRDYAVSCQLVPYGGQITIIHPESDTTFVTGVLKGTVIQYVKGEPR